jgi:hypothetical protein
MDGFVVDGDPAIASVTVGARSAIGPFPLEYVVVMGVRARTTASYARERLCPMLVSKLTGQSARMWFEIRDVDGTVLAQRGDC